MTVEPASGLPRPSDLEVGEPDVGFLFGVGAYVGGILTGLGATAAVHLEASPAGFVGLLPTTFTLGIVLGGVVAGRVPGLAVAVGCRRRRRLATLLPAAAFALSGIAALLHPELGDDLGLVTLFAAAIAAGPALLVAAMAENRYVDAVVDDDPAASWAWRRPGLLRWEFAAGAAFLAMALWSGAHGDRAFALLWGAYGLIWVLRPIEERRRGDDESGHAPELSVHDVGLVKSRGRTKSLVPWDAITDVRLTDDELVLERRFRNLRSDRNAIDDPESVRDAIERARGHADPR